MNIPFLIAALVAAFASRLRYGSVPGNFRVKMSDRLFQALLLLASLAVACCGLGDGDFGQNLMLGLMAAVVGVTLPELATAFGQEVAAQTKRGASWTGRQLGRVAPAAMVAVVVLALAASAPGLLTSLLALAIMCIGLGILIKKVL